MMGLSYWLKKASYWCSVTRWPLATSKSNFCKTKHFLIRLMSHNFQCTRVQTYI